MKKQAAGARLILAFLLCILLPLNLCSCWSRRELNTLAIVLGTGLDKGNRPDTLKLTAQVVKAGEIRAPSSESGGDTASRKAYANIQNTDKSVLSTIRGITHISSRRLYFPHNKILIFSSELARLDISEGLDAFMRDYESRMNVYILVSRGSASEILDENSELEKVPAVHISEMMKAQYANSETAVVTLRDFAIAMLSGTKAPVAPMIELYESEGKKRARLEGTAVFRGGKMVGELDKAQTRGLMWTTDKFKSGVMTVDTKWGQVVLEISHSSTSLKPVKTEEGDIRMKLKVIADGYIQSNETYEDMSRPENVEMLKEHLRNAILSDIENVLKQARSLSADVFGFGEAIRSEYPEEWENMKEKWDEEFREIGLDIQIEVKLRSTGGMIKPVVPGGAE